MQAGFVAIESILRDAGRPLTAFCACEMRSPEPFTETGFVDFNRVYVETLERWGLFQAENNPVARSNVCPEIDAPAEPSFAAFAYTVPRCGSNTFGPSFVVAGSGEAKEGFSSYQESVVRPGDATADGLREKARYVLGEMARRLQILGATWTDATATQVYTVFDLYPFLADEIVARGAAAAGLTWYYARPPIVGLDFEMDLRGVRTEQVVALP